MVAARTSRATRRTHLVYRQAASSSVQERINIVRHGLFAKDVATLADDLKLTMDKTVSILRLPKTTLMRKIKDGARLDAEQSERLLHVKRLIGIVDNMVHDYGDPTGFNASEWFGTWIEQPNPALGNKTPASYLDTVTGALLIESLLLKMNTGAYA